jgi:glutamine synthetase
MIRTGKRLAARRADWRNEVEFYLIDYRPDGGREKAYLLQDIGNAVTWEEQQEGFTYSAPSFRLYQDAAQELMDMLWHDGLRPRQQINEASRIEAVNRHLEDMRAIAFDRLKVAAPSQR